MRNATSVSVTLPTGPDSLFQVVKRTLINGVQYQPGDRIRASQLGPNYAHKVHSMCRVRLIAPVLAEPAAPAASPSPNDELEKWGLNQLIERCRSLGLPADGNKTSLRERLRAVLVKP